MRPHSATFIRDQLSFFLSLLPYRSLPIPESWTELTPAHYTRLLRISFMFSPFLSSLSLSLSLSLSHRLYLSNPCPLYVCTDVTHARTYTPARVFIRPCVYDTPFSFFLFSFPRPRFSFSGKHRNSPTTTPSHPPSLPLSHGDPEPFWEGKNILRAGYALFQRARAEGRGESDDVTSRAYWSFFWGCYGGREEGFVANGIFKQFLSSGIL